MPDIDTRNHNPSSIAAALGATWALLLGIGLLNLGDGLQATLLGVRAALESFPTTATGLLMSAFYIGFLAGSLFAPRSVERVGHIRVFGALASLASAAALIYSVFVTPWAWAVLRFVSGVCFAGLYIVAESWLNDRASNETRGQLLSVYMLVTFGGIAVGQLLLNVAHPGGYQLFILTSVLISVALVPLLLSAGGAPSFAQPAALSLRALYKLSPLGVLATALSGMSSAIFFSMGPVYAQGIGLSVRDISFFMTAAVLGCLVLQWPVGRLSDRLDRRRVLTGVTFLAALAAAVAIPAAVVSRDILLLAIACFGGLALPMYALAIAHANDSLEPEELVAASSGLVLASGVGAVLGPVSASAIMEVFGAQGFWWSLAAIHAFVGVFALYRMLRRSAKPLTDQGEFHPVSSRASMVAVEWTHDTEHGDEPTP
ncbi:MAG: MFS transporter [Gammaproteobacteria bacterium]|nr:MFS transporter [Gammaproteobacteria bacterium]